MRVNDPIEDENNDSVCEKNTDINEQVKNKGTKIDYLKEDKPLPGQNFVCVSFVSPEGIRNTTLRGLKIRGVFEKYEDAQEHAKKLQEEDPSFNIYVGEVGKWLPWDPNPEDKTKVKDTQYYEEELQKIVKGYEDNRERAKKAENDRKRELLQKSLETAKKNQKEKETLETKKDVLRKKVKDNKIQKSQTENKTVNEAVQSKNIDLNESVVGQKISKDDLEEEQKKLSQEKERLNKNENQIKQSEDNLRTLDTNLNKLKEIYNNMQLKKQTNNK